MSYSPPSLSQPQELELIDFSDRPSNHLNPVEAAFANDYQINLGQFSFQDQPPVTLERESEWASNKSNQPFQAERLIEQSGTAV